MIRDLMTTKRVEASTDFRWRGNEVTRIEGFSDAVFAFAVTLLVVSLEVPRTFTDLFETMRNFGAFAICFALLISAWYDHYQFFRRYALQDTLTVVLNAMLLFVLLFYVYPLKFLFTLLIKQLQGLPISDTMMRSDQFPSLLIIYGLGYIAVFAVFALLYGHAYRQRHALDLNDLEVSDTRNSIQRHLIHISIGVLSIAIALLSSVTGSQETAAWAGWVYFALAPALTLNGRIMGQRRRKLEQRYMGMLVATPNTKESAAR